MARYIERQNVENQSVSFAPLTKLSTVPFNGVVAYVEPFSLHVCHRLDYMSRGDAPKILSSSVQSNFIFGEEVKPFWEPRCRQRHTRQLTRATQCSVTRKGETMISVALPPAICAPAHYRYQPMNVSHPRFSTHRHPSVCTSNASTCFVTWTSGSSHARTVSSVRPTVCVFVDTKSAKQ